VAVLSAVKVEVAAVVPDTVAGDRIEHVTALTIVPAGLATAQVSVTGPVNPFDGVTLIVEVFPAVAPCTIEMLPLLLRENDGTGAAVTVTLTAVVEVMLPEVPVTVNV
jgi:hypothetical protein